MVATIIHGSEGETAISKKWTNLRPFRNNSLFRPWFDKGREEEPSCDDPVNVIRSACHQMKISKYTGQDILSDRDNPPHVDRFC